MKHTIAVAALSAVTFSTAFAGPVEECIAALPLPMNSEQDCRRTFKDAYWCGRESERTQYNENQENRAEECRSTKGKSIVKPLPGARIGMTTKQVRERTSWGEPDDINSTTTAYGTSEQWVYGGGNYLYFTNGRLTAIQN
jgi:hypothetical protein